MNKFITWTFLTLTIMSCRPQEKTVDPETYKQEIKSWRAHRLEHLKAPDGWLNLAGLYWLQEGDNTIGSDSSNTIVFPGSAPSFAGTIVKSGDSVSYLPAGNGPVSIDGQKVTGPVGLKTDMTGHPTVMESMPLAWFIIKRGDQYGIRLRDFDNPRIKELATIPSYPASLKWRIDARYVPFDKDSIFEVPTMIGGTEDYKCPGILEFKVDGTRTVLYPFETPNGFFIIFGDATSGKETYAAGRFLSTGKPGEHNRVIIDFNKAYNPPCAFSPYATCPLPPPENRLKVAITAGEKAVHLE